jgi:hypothetical protein
VAERGRNGVLPLSPSQFDPAGPAPVILTIALGIVLAVLILGALPLILAAGALTIVVVVVTMFALYAVAFRTASGAGFVMSGLVLFLGYFILLLANRCSMRQTRYVTTAAAASHGKPASGSASKQFQSFSGVPAGAVRTCCTTRRSAAERTSAGRDS